MPAAPCSTRESTTPINLQYLARAQTRIPTTIRSTLPENHDHNKLCDSGRSQLSSRRLLAGRPRSAAVRAGGVVPAGQRGAPGADIDWSENAAEAYDWRNHGQNVSFYAIKYM